MKRFLGSLLYGNDKLQFEKLKQILSDFTHSETVGYTSQNYAIVETKDIATEPPKHNRNSSLNRWIVTCSNKPGVSKSGTGAQIRDEQQFNFWRGKYSLAAFDVQSRLLHLQRDILGFQSLYYSKTNGKLLFSNHLGVLQKAVGERELSPEGIALFFLLGYIPSKFTLFKNIFKVKPAERLTINSDGFISQQQYWEPPAFAPTNESINTFRDEFRHEFLNVLREQTDGVEDVGLWLSGGIDSTVVGAVLSRDLQKKVHSITFGIDIKHPRIDYLRDVVFSESVAKQFKFSHSNLLIKSQFPIADHLIDLLPRDAELLLTPNVFTKHFLSTELQKKGLTSIFNGSAAGAVFERIRPKKLSAVWDNDQSDAHNYLKMLSRFLALEDIHALFPFTSHLTMDNIASSLDLTVSHKIDEPNDLVVFGMLRNHLPEKPLRLFANIESHTGMEIHTPFTDERLLKIGARIPLHMRCSNDKSKEKSLIKYFFADVLSMEIKERKKVGYPSYYWHQGQLDKLANLLSSAILSSDMPINQVYLKQLVESEKQAANKSAGKRFWGATIFFAWYYQHVLQKNLNALFTEKR
ncbi:MAG: asparagine synthase-related protein [Calditrichia bacterium]